MHTTHPKQVNYVSQWRSVVKNDFAGYHVLAFSPWMTEPANKCHSDTSLACRLQVQRRAASLHQFHRACTSSRSGINTAPLSIKVRAWDSVGDAALSSLLTRCQQKELQALKDFEGYSLTEKNQDFGYFLKQKTVPVHLKEMHEKPQPEI